MFPSQQAAGNPREIEEERRLFYVAVTRAEQHLIITYAKSRLHYGKMEFGNPSRFINDLGREFIVLGTNRAIYTGGQKDIELPWRKPRIPVQTPKTPTQPLSTSGRQASPAFGICAGQHVQHERFGTGVVLAVEGVGDNQKATVEFVNVGEKQLLLKFARLRVVD